MTGQTFTAEFIAKCKPATLAMRDPKDEHRALLWIRWGRYQQRAAFMACSCEDVAVMTCQRFAYSKCNRHGFQSLGRLPMSQKNHAMEDHR